MTPQEALEASIGKWRAIVGRRGGDHGRQDCALCNLFCRNGGCTGCPVRAATGLNYCRGTPYTDWSRAAGSHAGSRTDPIRFTDEMLAAARAELAFLESLRPTTNGG